MINWLNLQFIHYFLDTLLAQYMLWACACLCLSLITSRSSTKTARCRITLTVPHRDWFETGWWLYCIWLYKRFLFTNAEPHTEPCLRLCLGSLSNFSFQQPVCSCKWTTSVHTEEKALYPVFLKLSLSTHNPTYDTLFNCKFKDFFHRKPNKISPVGIRIQADLRAVGFAKVTALQYTHPATPWNVLPL